jgi:spermidine synthase
MSLLLCAVFFLSGASALIFEALWFRQAGLTFGNSVWASSLVLAGFMAGLALGNALAARHGDRLARPVLAYALVEVVIGVSGLALVYLLPALAPLLGPLLRPILEVPWALNAIRLLLAFALLLVPSTAMGVTLPLLSKALSASERNFGRVLGRLYGWNTLGAVLGAASTETLLVGRFGVRGSALVAASLNGVAALAAFGIARRLPALAAAPSARPPIWSHPEARRLLLATFGSGFALLALEVIWFRFLNLFLSNTSAMFPIVLASVLAGIALGGLAASHWLRLRPGASRAASPVAFASAALCVGTYAGFSVVLRELAPAWNGWIRQAAELGVALTFPVSFLSGCLFTLIGAALKRDLVSETAAAGALTFANTTGAALGSLVAGFVLLPVLGMERSLFSMALLYGALGLLLLDRVRTPRVAAGLAGAVAAGSLLLFPFGAMRERYLQVPIKRYASPETVIREIREGLTETIVYLQQQVDGRPYFYRLLTNNFTMSGTRWDARRYMKLYVYWPAAVHPDLRSALLISFGVGSTAKALRDTRSLETIDIVDISRDVLDLAHVPYPDPAENPVLDPRVRVHVEDGRQFLQTTDRRFDLITSEPPPPQIAGVVNLYTREYFALMRDRLNEGGIVTYWLPIHSLGEEASKAVIAAFCSVFADCSLWQGYAYDMMLVGTRHATGPGSADAFRRQWADPEVAAEMSGLGLERPEQLGALFVADARDLDRITSDTAPLVDDFPKRIGDRPPQTIRPTLSPLYRSWTSAGEARRRFEQSALIARLWPAELRAATLPYFEQQAILNRLGFGYDATDDAPSNPLEDLHRLLTRTDLRVLPLLLMGTDADLQRIAEAEAESGTPFVQLQLGMRALADRRYGDAADRFAAAEAGPAQRPLALRLRVLALCMVGDVEGARRLAHERQPEMGPVAAQRAYWQWMAATFGVGPFAS